MKRRAMLRPGALGCVQVWQPGRMATDALPKIGRAAPDIHNGFFNEAEVLYY
jgi:hypothetical protein